MNNVMVDTETLGTKPGCTVLSIGACTFDPRGEGNGSEFYRVINVFDSLMQGFEINADTLEWWKKQSSEAKQTFSEAQSVTLWQALEDFAQWFADVEGEQVWCQGATFDAPILEECFERVNPGTPWKFWNVRDTRTVYDVCDFDSKSVERAGTYHNALDDAKHQVLCVQTALRPRPCQEGL